MPEMKLPVLVAILTVATSFYCISKHDKFKFGPEYNEVRLKYGSPLIKKDMAVHNCCGAWTTYERSQIPADGRPYHASKTIRAITDEKLTQEEDIYRKGIDDSTLIQINILSAWKWKENKIVFSGNMGKIDKRVLNLKAKEYLTQHEKYIDYMWINLNLVQIDSALKSWGLSRADLY